MARYYVKLLLAGLLAFAGLAPVQAQNAYPLFAPANGVLKGDVNNYVTTAAAGSDITALFSGSCDITKWLRGDASCQSLSALTKVDDTNVTLTLGGAPTTALHTATSLTLGWTGTLAATRGGLGFSTVTDDTTPVASGALWVSTALPNCIDSAGQHLNYTAATNLYSCGTTGAGGLTGLANPTGTIGLTAVNGAATTAPRSDSAPALSQAIVPTWTGAHTFTNALGTPSFASNSSVVGAGSSGGKIKMVSSGAAANAKTVELTTGTTLFLIRTVDDLDSATSNILSATRSGVSTTDVSLGNATSNPTYNLLGTGLTTIGGAFASTNAAGSVSWSGPDNTAAGANFSVGANTNPSSLASRGSLFINGINSSILTFGLNEATTAYVFADPSNFILNGGASQVTSIASNGATALTAALNQGLFTAGATGGSQGSGTINATGLFVNGVSAVGTTQGTATATFNGFSAGLTRTLSYSVVGSLACFSIPSGTGTSNTTAFTITGIPAAIQLSSTVASGVFEVTDNGTTKFGYWRLPSGSGTLTFSNGVNGTAFTGSGTKGIGDNFSACYNRN